MDEQEVAAAIAEARRFIEAAERWQRRVASDGHAPIGGTRDGGAMRRASLDLSAALSAMRRPAYRRGGDE